MPNLTPTTYASGVRLPQRVAARPAFRWSLLRRIKSELAAELQSIFGSRVRAGFGILSYHRVHPLPPGLAEPTWNVTPELLESQLSGLLRAGFTPWPLSRVLAEQAAGRAPPPRTFVVTFDDGYANNLTHALPVLLKLGVPATLFLATAYLGWEGPLPFDDWELAGSSSVPAEAWRALTLAECHTLLESGIFEFGAHTHTHDDFRNRPAELTCDLAICRSLLQREFGVVSPMFAFTYGTKNNGFVSPELAAAVRAAGMACALTTEAQVVRPGDDCFDWGRFEATSDDTARTLAAKLGGWLTRWGVCAAPAVPTSQQRPSAARLRAIARSAADRDALEAQQAAQAEARS